jgi:hypothetical protein
LDDVVQDFLVDRIQAITVTLVVQAGDEASFGRLLRRSIRNWLVDHVRKTGIGALRRSIEKVLADEGAFEQVPAREEGAGRWRLVGTSVQPWTGGVGDLVSVAWSVPHVRVPKWSSDSRRSPVADKPSMVAVARAVMEAASGSLEVGQLVAVFAQRFAATLDPIEVSLPEDREASATQSREHTPEDHVLADVAELDSAASAAAIVGLLSPQERELVPYLADSQAIQDVLGCGRSQAYQHAARLKEKIIEFAGNGEEARAVVLEVIRLCGGAVDRR